MPLWTGSAPCSLAGFKPELLVLELNHSAPCLCGLGSHQGTCRYVFSGRGFHEGAVTCLATHPKWSSDQGDDGDDPVKVLLTGSEDGTAKLLHIGTKKVLATFAHAAAAADGSSAGTAGEAQTSLEAFSVDSVGFCSSFPWIATAGQDGTCKIWDTVTTHLRHVLTIPDASIITKLIWHPEQPLVFMACGDGVLRQWDGRQGGGAADFTGHDDMILDLQTLAHPTRAGVQFLISASDDQTAKVFCHEHRHVSDRGGRQT